ncbi:MAG TPA: RsiV family protein [Anaerolineales bacterium]|nr:RsiV family protein [Anaerolineales bacterium]HNO32368.1 RsiV family protein [Anaerolineales bacterium]
MKKSFVLWMMALGLAAVACNLPGQMVERSVTDVPEIPTEVPTIMPPMPLLSEKVTILSEPFSETGDKPIYTINAQIPYAQGPDPARLANFNTLLKKTADDQIQSFRDSVLTLAPVEPINVGSSFNLQYSVVRQVQDYWSLKYEVDAYFDGAAHPGHYSATLNYDLASDRLVTLDELFLPGSNYLQVISEYCKAELAKRDIGFDGFSAGADPLPENYTHWNLSADGLIITFDEYQVAPYAAGPQVVIIPPSALASVMDSQDGILFLFTK